jgi:5-methyltetrahydrofolate--homocysteine methyltransferase
VEQDLAELFPGEVRYARDAFEGLRLMDAIMAVKRGEEGRPQPQLRERRVKKVDRNFDSNEIDTRHGDVADDIDIPSVPFFGSTHRQGIPLAEYLGMLDERALFVGQWGLRAHVENHEAMVENEGRPELRRLLNEVQSQGWLKQLLCTAISHVFQKETTL